MSFCISFCSMSWIHKQAVLCLDYFPLSCEGTQTSRSLPCSEGICYLHFADRTVSRAWKKWYRYKDGKDRLWMNEWVTKNISPRSHFLQAQRMEEIVALSETGTLEKSYKETVNCLVNMISIKDYHHFEGTYCWHLQKRWSGRFLGNGQTVLYPRIWQSYVYYYEKLKSQCCHPKIIQKYLLMTAASVMQTQAQPWYIILSRAVRYKTIPSVWGATYEVHWEEQRAIP
jgi:hypothetical protein